ncbi:deoxyribose-phosphate aldolase [Alienimonas chondri]|uniref:Deoxyribose-phosphate aldolase n=1 Tax=Alienimonas chondri TaxID=2681879 RepID=A0ABX1VH73_9PLAN|nr:deoxyribose-phosphate aldolase [Alienimonas chondri]NNJ27504.1 Deoxyribose-phosphate aldolase 2 [Alienimonas chondri]
MLDLTSSLVASQSAATPSDWSLEDLAGLIDHALLAPTLTDDDYDRGCDLAAAYGVASVCVSPHKIADVARRLAGTGVKTGTVIGFPHGLNAAAIKAAEARTALADGAVELDMVVNVSRVLSGDWDDVGRDIAGVTSAAREVGAKTKVIFETGHLNDAQKAKLCELCGVAGADWVKTSTGFGPGGATDHDLKLMLAHAPPGVEVKASGGIKTLDRLLEVRALGVTRVGMSGTAAILGEASDRLGLPRRWAEQSDDSSY